MSRVFYRIGKGPEPMVEDFKPHKELGIPLQDTKYEREWSSSVSVFDRFDVVRRNALKFPTLGSFIATVVVPEDGSVEFAQTTLNRHHFSIYAPPHVVLNLVVGNPVPVNAENHNE